MHVTWNLNNQTLSKQKPFTYVNKEPRNIVQKFFLP